MHKLEGNATPVKSMDGDYTLIIDRMVYAQQAKISKMTYGDFATNLLKSCLLPGKDAKQIDVVFYVYKDQSIKKVERERRSQGVILSTDH